MRAKDKFGIAIKMQGGNQGMILLAHDSGRSFFSYNWDSTDSDVIDLGRDYTLRPDPSKSVSKVYPSRDAGSMIFANSEGNFFAIALIDSADFRLFDLSSGEPSNNSEMMIAFPSWRIGAKETDETITWLINENDT